jgi:hypothetical protein
MLAQQGVQEARELLVPRVWLVLKVEQVVLDRQVQQDLRGLQEELVQRVPLA